MITGDTQRRRTIAAEPGSIGVVRMALGALFGQAGFPSLTWAQIIRGTGGKSIRAWDEWRQMTSVLDTSSETQYHHPSNGRVRVPVNPLDFKNDLRRNQRRLILPC
jgi:hypothetical protein